MAVMCIHHRFGGFRQQMLVDRSLLDAAYLQRVGDRWRLGLCDDQVAHQHCLPIRVLR
jgi:hypothetical protein